MIKLITAFCLILLAAPLCAADHLQQGARFLEAGNLHRAVRAYELALKNNEESAAAHKGLGLAYYRLGDFQVGYNTEMIASAVREFRASLDLKPDPELYYRLGLCYLILYQKEKAVEVQRALAPLEPALAYQLAEKIAAYVKPPRLEVAYQAVTGSPESGGPGGATPVVISGNSVLVPVTLSYRGTSVRVRLLLDTGASVTTISEAVAAQLGVQNGDTNPATGVLADGRRVDARWFVVDSVGVGPKTATQLRAAILLRSGGAGYDGLLGMDFLRKFRYQVDFDRQVIDWMN